MVQNGLPFSKLSTTSLEVQYRAFSSVYAVRQMKSRIIRVKATYTRMMLGNLNLHEGERSSEN